MTCETACLRSFTTKPSSANRAKHIVQQILDSKVCRCANTTLMCSMISKPSVIESAFKLGILSYLPIIGLQKRHSEFIAHRERRIVEIVRFSRFAKKGARKDNGVIGLSVYMRIHLP
jgi:hypothetical protein